MKQVWNSIFQTVSQSVRALSENVGKKVHRDVVLMTTGISVVTLLTFTAGDLQGGGSNTMVAFAETHVQTAETETILEETNSEDLAVETENSEEETLEIEAEETIQAEETAMDETEESVFDEEHKNESEAEEEVESEPVQEDSEAEETEESDEVVLSASEYNVLLRIVQAESGGCDEMGKLLVANVILNRMESEEFPDTVTEVVYQKNQFSPVIDGSINTCKVSMETREAVNRALKGEDYSEGALYFMNRSCSASKNVRWFDANLDYLFKHGDHEFFK